MSRRRKSMPQYGEPTVSVTVRIPARLHGEIKTRAKRERITKSRKIVQMLSDAVGSLPVDAAPETAGSVFE